MLNGFDASLEERLRMAEQAETEVERLRAKATEAPALRAEKARLQRAAERRRAREAAMAQATEAVESSSIKQNRVAELLGNAARSVNELYGALKEIESLRQDAMQSLAVADRVDYEVELEDGEAHERSLDRDPRGLAYALAGRHGETRVLKLLEELQPGFELLLGCNMDDPLNRDVARFVMQRITPAAPPPAAGVNNAATSRPNNSRTPEIHEDPPAHAAPAPQPDQQTSAFMVDSEDA